MRVGTSIAIALLLNPCGQCFADAAASREDMPAKGEKKCMIYQIDSRMLTEYYANAVRGSGYSSGKASSHMKFRVYRDGSVSALYPETYPGSKLYVMIDGSRFSGNAEHELGLDVKAVAALKADKPFDYTWTAWPDRRENSMKDRFDGFTAAYETCRAFLGTKKP